MSNIMHPCLWFDGKAKEAADFYCTVFEDSSITQSNPMVTMFQVFGKPIMALNGGPMFQINPSISLFVTCASIEETNKVWAQLIEGGSALIAMDKQPWSERYGWVKDKFGMTWQVMVNNEAGKRSVCPSLLFTDAKFGKAGSAIDYYTSVFKNSSVNVKELYPAGDAANAGKVMFSEIALNGFIITLMDGPGNHNYTFSEGVSLVINCNDQQEIDYYWDHFTSEGGKESMCGWCKDKFGVWWQVIPASLGKLMSGPNAQKVVEAFMKMKKFVIADLEKAAGS